MNILQQTVTKTMQGEENPKSRQSNHDDKNHTITLLLLKAADQTELTGLSKLLQSNQRMQNDGRMAMCVLLEKTRHLNNV